MRTGPKWEAFCEAATIYNGFTKWWSKELEWVWGWGCRGVAVFGDHCEKVPRQQSLKNTIKVSSIQSSENWWHIYLRMELEFGGRDAVMHYWSKLFLRSWMNLINTPVVMEEHKGQSSKSELSIRFFPRVSSWIQDFAFLFRCQVVFLFFFIVSVFLLLFNGVLNWRAKTTISHTNKWRNTALRLVQKSPPQHVAH